MSEVGDVSDDTSHDFMFIVSRSSAKPRASHWLANDNGLGVEYRVVTNTGDSIVWSS